MRLMIGSVDHGIITAPVGLVRGLAVPGTPLPHLAFVCRFVLCGRDGRCYAEESS
jgi:hypothetical protein